MRDDFSLKTIETLAKRVGCRCSNPGCRKLTSGPHEEAHKSVNIGVAAHITAAAPGGKRYNPGLSSEERKSIENGMWLCQNCGKLVDSDEQKYSVALLLDWKRAAENQAGLEIENANPQTSGCSPLMFDTYLRDLVDTPQTWWLDAINDSTWYEFKLFTKVQEKSGTSGEEPKELPKRLLQAIHDSEERAILIVGDPGAGKSTFLDKLAVEAARKAQEDSNAPIPVLVRLKDYDSLGKEAGIRGLIQSTLENYVDTDTVNQLLKDRKILLLIDGWNELSDEKAKSKIKIFCQPHSVIVTSRNTGDYWEIQKKFEIQPLTRRDVEEFFDKRLLNTERQQLQELVDRVQDFGQTPLMVWMLFSIFQNNDPIPDTRGEAYRSFTAIYAKRAKADIDLSDARKLLGKLAFEMMKSPNPKDPTEFRLKISEVGAEEILGSEAELDRMLNHLLNQQGKEGTREISFCHQSIQEYYAAEHLRLELKQHPEWRQKQSGENYPRLQHDYLNYTKWTEPISLMLGLCEKNIAIPIVEQALEVDLMLGARLAGEVQSELQNETINLVRKPVRQVIGIQKSLNIPIWLKIKLYKQTNSPIVIPLLKEIIHGADETNIWLALEALFEGFSLDISEFYPILGMTSVQEFSRKSIDADNEKLTAETALEKFTEMYQKIAIEFRRFYEEIEQRLNNRTFQESIPILLASLKDEKSILRWTTADMAGIFASKGLRSRKIISALFKIAIYDRERKARESARNAIGKFQNNRAAYLLPRIITLIPSKSGHSLFETIAAIQANCKFYNYEIFHSPPANLQIPQHLSSTTINVAGDLIVGDKIERDKVLGNKTEVPNAPEVKIFEQVDNYHEFPPRDPPP
jgi:NACHT domain